MNLNLNAVLEKMDQTRRKIEGDKKTPKGTFEIENLYFRKDRKKNQKLLKCIEIKKTWVGVMILRFPKKYNKLFKIDKKIKYMKN